MLQRSDRVVEELSPSPFQRDETGWTSFEAAEGALRKISAAACYQYTSDTPSRQSTKVPTLGTLMLRSQAPFVWTMEVRGRLDPFSGSHPDTPDMPRQQIH